MTTVRVMLLLAGLASTALAQTPTLTRPADIAWGEHPFIKGAQLAVQSGDPAQGPSVLLMRFPKGLTIPAHTHTSDETVTLISGSGIFGGGESVEAAKGAPLAQGGFITIPAGCPHWAIAREDLVISVTLTRPADFHLCAPR